MNREHDVLLWVEDRLQQAREAAAHWIDRAEALRELRSIADSAAAGLNQTHLSPDHLWRWPGSEEQRARLVALVNRATEPNDGGT